MGLTGLDAIADALYAGDPAEFVAARDAAAKQARGAGDRALATAIKALRRPSVAAWYVNVAARASLVSLREWLALGTNLRAAQAALDTARVRELSAGRTKLEARVIRDLSAHLATLGVTVSTPALDEVRATLRAALADQAAADLLAAGRLDKPLSYAGFGEVDLSAALAAMAQAQPEPAPDPALLAALEEARVQLADAEEAAREAEEGVGRAEAAVAVAQRELREARGRLKEAEARRSASALAVEKAEGRLGEP